MWNDYYYYEKNWKPNLGVKSIKKRVAKQMETIRSELAAETRTLDELLPIALEHAESRARLVKTPFEEYMAWFIEQNPETEDVHNARLIANYLRHQVTSYDSYISTLLNEYWVDEFFFDHWWYEVMSAIVERYPELEIARERGWLAKQGYDDYKYQKHLEAERRWREQEEERLRVERESRQKESAIADSIILKDGVTDLLVYDRGRLYVGKVLKVNKKTIKVTWTLKQGGVKEKLFKKAFLYINNKDAFDVTSEVDAFLEEQHGNLLRRASELKVVK